VLETGHGEVIGREPKDAEREGEASSGEETKVGSRTRGCESWGVVKAIVVVVVVGLEEGLGFFRRYRVVPGRSPECRCSNPRAVAARPESLVS
jgi:hypothetical protein